ncbi:MAG: ABC transporter ATP-binding protein/permease [Firmicutes bacterium]|nr:ABC transporter ATP-binding protein/permease [Bacillota bacterium]
MVKAIQAALAPLGKRYVGLHMAGMFILAAAAAVFNVYYADMLGRLAGQMESGADPWGAVYRMLAALLAVCLVAVAEQAYRVRLRCDVVERYQRRFSHSLLKARMKDIRNLNAGDVYVRGTSDLLGAAGIWTSELWKLTSNVCRIAASMVAIILIRPLFCLFMMLVIVGAFLLQVIVSRPMQGCRKKIFDALGEAESVSGDLLGNLETVQVEKAQKWAFTRYENALRAAEGQYRRQLPPICLMMSGGFLCSMLPMLFGIFYPALSYMRGEMALAECVTVITLALSVAAVIQSMVQILGTLQQDIASLQRVAEVWSLESEQEAYRNCGSYRFRDGMSGQESPQLKAAPDLEPGAGGGESHEVFCRVRELTFGYSEENSILRGWSCDLERNRLYLLTGINGAGKSTFSKLLTGLYLPEAGTIEYCLKGQERAEDLRERDLHALRLRVVIGEQDPVLFRGSILDNIRKGNEALSTETVREWCDSTGVSRVLDGIQGGLEAAIEQKGVNLSGGQKKCISVSRALLSEADMIILDEPTANLSSDISEVIYRQVARTLQKGRGQTVLVITHDGGFEAAFPDAQRLSMERIVSMEAEDRPQICTEKSQ